MSYSRLKKLNFYPSSNVYNLELWKVWVQIQQVDLQRRIQETSFYIIISHVTKNSQASKSISKPSMALARQEIKKLD